MLDLLYEILSFAGQGLSLERTQAIGDVLGQTMWRALASRRALAVATVAERLDLPRDQAEALARLSFSHTMRSFLEILHTRRFDWRFMGERVTVAEPELLAASQQNDRPQVLATAHLGAWELMGGICWLYYRHRHNVVVVRRPKDLALHRTMTRLRTRLGLGVVEHRNAAFKVLKILKRGGSAAFLVDHNCSRSEAVFLPFLGRIAAVNVGPALLAVRAEAVIQPMVMVRTQEPGRFVLHLSPPLDTALLAGSREERVGATALFYTRAMEEFVRRFPEQWFWMHKRWKTRPPGEGAAEKLQAKL